METRSYIVKKYDELNDAEKEKVLARYGDINVDFDWWDSTYEDAKTIGLKLTGFDLGRAQSCEGKFINSAEESAHAIEKEHGDTTSTYTTAKAYLKTRDEIINTATRDADGEFVNEGELDDKLDESDAEFLRDLLQDYWAILQSEYEYLTGREAVEETLRINEYDFDVETGRID